MEFEFNCVIRIHVYYRYVKLCTIKFIYPMKQVILNAFMNMCSSQFNSS